jgi:hypothetical protein
MHPFLNEFELDDGQQPDDKEQDHRLRGGRSKVLAHETVRENFIYQNRRRLLRPARSDRVDHTKGFKEGIDHVDDQQEEGGGESKGNTMVQNRFQKRAPSMAAASITERGTA